MIHKVDAGIFVLSYTYNKDGNIVAGWSDIEVGEADEWEVIKKYVINEIERVIGVPGTPFVVNSWTRIQ